MPRKDNSKNKSTLSTQILLVAKVTIKSYPFSIKIFYRQ